jgi:L-lactate dehydrogenase complex protein LldG
MSGREAVLGKIRRALAVSGSQADRKAAVDGRLAGPAANLIPERGQLEGAARIDLFCKMAEAVQAGVTRVASADDVPAAIAGFLRQNNLPAEIRLGEDERLAALRWEKEPRLGRRCGNRDTRPSLRDGQSDDAEFPAGYPYRACRCGRYRRRL